MDAKHLSRPKAGVYIYTPALGPFEWTFNIEIGLTQEYIYTPALGPFEWMFNIEMGLNQEYI